MEFEWDESKRQKTFFERGIDFIDAALVIINSTTRSNLKVLRLADQGKESFDNQCFEYE